MIYTTADELCPYLTSNRKIGHTFSEFKNFYRFEQMWCDQVRPNDIRKHGFFLSSRTSSDFRYDEQETI